MTKNIKFEDKLKELEKIINELENGDLEIEESIKKYSKAMELANECDKTLKNIEEQVAKIVLENGEVEDFTTEN